MKEENLPEILKKFFKGSTSFTDEMIFVVRGDGIVVYSIGDNIDKNSIGALIGGVWQAAKALTQFIPEQSQESNFRLSFDTSANGIYILPFLVGQDEYYLGQIYFSQENPGPLKNKLREVLVLLQEHFKAIGPVVTSTKNERGDYLFSQITDDEMDKMFSFAGP